MGEKIKQIEKIRTNKINHIGVNVGGLLDRFSIIQYIPRKTEKHKFCTENGDVMYDTKNLSTCGIGPGGTILVMYKKSDLTDKMFEEKRAKLLFGDARMLNSGIINSFTKDEKRQFERAVLQLLINSLGKRVLHKNCINSTSNLYAHAKDVFNKEEELVEKVFLKIGVSNDSILFADVVSFSKAERPENTDGKIINIEDGKKTEGKKPATLYIVRDGCLYALSRAGENISPEEQLYKKEKYFKSSKNIVKYARMSADETVEALKSNILNNVLVDINERYGDIIELSFENLENVTKIKPKSLAAQKTALLRAIRDRKVKINIIDNVTSLISDKLEDEDYYKKMAQKIPMKTEQLLSEIKTVFPNSEVVCSDCSKQGCWNFNIVLTKDQYVSKRLSDDYCFSDSMVIQNVTADTFTSMKPPVLLISLIKECLIKEDVINHRISAVPVDQGTAALFPEYMIRTEKNGLPVYYKMTLLGDNDFDFSVIDDVDAEDIDNDLMFEFGIDTAKHLKRIELIMQQPDGEYAIITKTGKSVFLDTSKYKPKDMSRGEAFIDTFAPELCDINYTYTSGNTCEYYVGVPQHGMESDIARTNTIREIIFRDSCPDLASFFKDFDTNMIRATGPSVLPFAAKYLREFAKVSDSADEEVEE